jgi:hypothetical protein
MLANLPQASTMSMKPRNDTESWDFFGTESLRHGQVRFRPAKCYLKRHQAALGVCDAITIE